MTRDFSTGDGGFSRRFTASELAAMRKLAADEDSLGRKLFAKLARAARSAPFAEDVVSAWWCLRDPATSPRVKFILLSAVAYFVLPIDAVPDLVPLLGFTDDAAVIGAAIAAVASAVKPEHRQKAKQTLENLGD